MTDPFENLLERLVPGAGRKGALDADAPLFPRAMGLEPRGLLARGGTGEVHLAWDPLLEREVAVKIARADGGDAAREALLREARVTARLEHPAVLPVHRVYTGDDTVLIEFRLAPAATLESLFVDWRAEPAAAWPLTARLRVLAGAAGAVACAHALDVVHGDLHPGNLAVSAAGDPYVLDWGSRSDVVGTLTGSPAYAAPEQLRGAPADAASDVWALGALVWEACTLRPFRPRRHGEGLAEYVARWRDAEAPSTSGIDDDLARLLAAVLAADPDRRPPAAEVGVRLAALLAHRVELAAREAEAEAYLGRARDALGRFQELARRLSEERRVVAVQRAKVPGHAPIENKRPIWEAEDRAAHLAAERDAAWVDAADAADRSLALTPSLVEAREVLAELWWIRMEDAEARGERGLARVLAARALQYDDGRWARRLHAPSHLTLSTAVDGARARVFRYRERGRRLVPELAHELAMPIERLALAPGSWLVEIDAPGKATARYPVLLGRLDHHRGRVRLYAPEEVGEGWVFVPGGPFRLGGDGLARQPLDPCTPVLDDLFVMRTCVTSRAWKTFLDALEPDVASRHVPGEQGLFGGFRAYWRRGEDGWELPPGWDPDWPVMAVTQADARAYAAWLGERTRRPMRLPTEEEWEKAARGVDGRSFPWGNGFDPTFAHMRQSQAGPPRPAPVASYPVDVSPYGCADMAGGMREWTSSLLDDGQAVIRGGTWGDDADDLRVASRSGLHLDFSYSFVSFRLVSESPASR
ncbi:MAG: SUMF1/EgtB/PvdO family nonheme iron enzyme [Myxococcota bacterium]